MPGKKKGRKTLLRDIERMKRRATGKAWEALHRAEASIARGEGKIRKGTGRPKGGKNKKKAKA